MLFFHAAKRDFKVLFVFRYRLIENESTKADLMSELERANSEGIRLRSMLIEEQDECRKAVSRQKTLEKKFHTMLTDLKTDTSRQESILRKSLQLAKEERRLAIEKGERLARDLTQVQRREKVTDKSLKDGMRDLETVERQHKKNEEALEEKIRKLRQDLSLSRQDVTVALSKEVERVGDGEAKMRAVLAQLQKATEEVAMGR